MNDVNDLKFKILFEFNTSLKDFLAHVSIKKELFNEDEKHELFIRAEQRSKELNCLIKILILVVQFIQRDINLRICIYRFI